MRAHAEARGQSALVFYNHIIHRLGDFTKVVPNMELPVSQNEEEETKPMEMESFNLG